MLSVWLAKLPEAEMILKRMTDGHRKAVGAATESAPAPCVTRADIEANIVSEHYGVASDLCAQSLAHVGGKHYPKALDLLTFCVLVLRNGATVTAESSCPNPLLFNAERGRAVARKKAIRKLKEMMDGELMRQLAEMSEFVDLVDSWAGVKPVK